MVSSPKPKPCQFSSVQLRRCVRALTVSLLLGWIRVSRRSELWAAGWASGLRQSC